jgi:hypothetical protein
MPFWGGGTCGPRRGTHTIGLQNDTCLRLPSPIRQRSRSVEKLDEPHGKATKAPILNHVLGTHTKNSRECRSPNRSARPQSPCRSGELEESIACSCSVTFESKLHAHHLAMPAAASALCPHSAQAQRKNDFCGLAGFGRASQNSGISQIQQIL